MSFSSIRELDQLSIFGYLYEDYKIRNKIRLIELFAGVGSQAMALRDLGADFESYRVVEFDKYAIKSYVCNCDECKKRGQAEFELFDEKGRYIQHIKYSELKDKRIIEHYNPYDLCDLLHEKLISRNKNLSERFKGYDGETPKEDPWGDRYADECSKEEINKWVWEGYGLPPIREKDDVD